MRSFDIDVVPGWLPDGYRLLAREFIKLLDDPKILAVGGMRGTGKSTLAWGLIVKFCDLGRRSIYRTVPEMFNELSNAPWEEKQKIRNSYFDPHLLVLDEVQVRDDGRQWQDNELTTLIDRRYREQRATILLSNLKGEELRMNLGDSIWRRLIETGGLPIETNWERIEEIKARIAAERKAKANERPKVKI